MDALVLSFHSNHLACKSTWPDDPLWWWWQMQASITCQTRELSTDILHLMNAFDIWYVHKFIPPINKIITTLQYCRKQPSQYFGSRIQLPGSPAPRSKPREVITREWPKSSYAPRPWQVIISTSPRSKAMEKTKVKVMKPQKARELGENPKKVGNRWGFFEMNQRLNSVVKRVWHRNYIILDLFCFFDGTKTC